LPAKTLHITNSWHETSGGISTCYKALMRYANAHARTMRLVVPGEQARSEAFGEHCRIYYIPALRAKVGDPSYRLMWPWGPTGSAIRKILREEQPDLVEISDKWSLPILGGLLRAGWLDGIRRPALVGTSHERLHDNMAVYLKAGALGDWMSRTMLHKYYWLMFDHHVANSPYTAGELLPAAVSHKVHRGLHVLPMGVDTDGLDPDSRTPGAQAALAERASLPHGAKLLVYAGRLAHEKNLPLLVDMLEKLPPDYHLLIAGDGPMREWLQTQGTRRTGGRLHLLGHLNGRAELAKLHAGAGAFIHPNPREPFGIAPLEAMAAGVPLVAPSTGGVRFYAGTGNAWIADTTPEAYAQAATAVFADPVATGARCAAARQTALAHNWPTVAARFFQLWDDILSGVQIRLPEESPDLVAAHDIPRGPRPGTAWFRLQRG